MTGAAPSEREQRERSVLALAASRPGPPLDGMLTEVAAALQAGFPHYTGVYIYWMDGPDALVLRAYRGRPTEHTRIPVAQGVCGRAARERRTVVVDDVHADAAYLACSLETRSEIVVPIMRGGEVVGEIDIDGDEPAAYGPHDARFLEALAAAIAARL
jgi:L-methionine (R)-S-oxide reductase